MVIDRLQGGYREVTKKLHRRGERNIGRLQRLQRETRFEAGDPVSPVPFSKKNWGHHTNCRRTDVLLNLDSIVTVCFCEKGTGDIPSTGSVGLSHFTLVTSYERGPDRLSLLCNLRGHICS